MKLLLDTHTIIWLVYDQLRIPPTVKQGIAEADDAAASAVSGWEYEFKRMKYRDALPLTFLELIDMLALSPLDFPFSCHSYASSLPPIHADPFDRMLVAHALREGATLVTHDAAIRRYPVETLW